MIKQTELACAHCLWHSTAGRLTDLTVQQAAQELPSPKRARTGEAKKCRAPAEAACDQQIKAWEASAGEPAAKARPQTVSAPGGKASQPAAIPTPAAAPRGERKARPDGRQQAAAARGRKRPHRQVLPSSSDEAECSGSEYEAASLAASGETSDSSDAASSDSEPAPKAVKARNLCLAVWCKACAQPWLT